MGNNKYYNELWHDDDKDGTIFWKRVEFDTEPYQIQERTFRNLISYLVGHDIHSVLELGIGTGRMTKIVMEELGLEDFSKWPNPKGIQKYDALDIRPQVDEIQRTLGRNNFKHLTLYNLDVTSKEFDLIFAGKWGEYDLILASEVFMHLLPEDIDKVISKITKLLNDNGHIINIDWAYDDSNSNWCFIHEYDRLYDENGLTPISYTSMRKIKQGIWQYRRNG